MSSMVFSPSCPVIGGCRSFSMAVMRSFSMGGMAGCGWVFVRILVSLLVVMVIWCCRRSAFRVADYGGRLVRLDDVRAKALEIYRCFKKGLMEDCKTLREGLRGS